MFNEFTPSIYPAIREWEEAGVSLSTAPTKYLSMSLSLGARSVSEGIPLESLATRVDVALGSLHITLEREIVQARSTLAQTRNRILSPVFRFPEEVLSEIFINVVFAPTNQLESDVEEVDTWPMEYSIMKIYRALHKLLAVCSVWRKIALARGVFWCTVPIFDSPIRVMRRKQATNLSIERAGTGDLHLVATLPYGSNVLDLDALAKHATRFRTANILTKVDHTTRAIMETLLDQASPGPSALS
ncbi:hypothetical protein FRC11_003153 [Ceratobasidium sp. 423]|nr:hypothetical protein FRC11_003153 [Ceratobasidium sp. 423]